MCDCFRYQPPFCVGRCGGPVIAHICLLETVNQGRISVMPSFPYLTPILFLPPTPFFPAGQQELTPWVAAPHSHLSPESLHAAGRRDTFPTELMEREGKSYQRNESLEGRREVKILSRGLKRRAATQIVRA